jgi:hypothetical protein
MNKLIVCTQHVLITQLPTVLLYKEQKYEDLSVSHNKL